MKIYTSIPNTLYISKLSTIYHLLGSIFGKSTYTKYNILILNTFIRSLKFSDLIINLNINNSQFSHAASKTACKL